MGGFANMGGAANPRNHPAPSTRPASGSGYTGPSSSAPSGGRGGTLSAQQVYALARRAGATVEEAVILTAIAKYESGYFAGAYNGENRDRSYGLWQINMLGDMGPERRQALGLSSNEQLFDPATNARAALMILRRQGWKAWSVYTSGAYKGGLAEARAAASAVGDNVDAVALSAAGVGGSVTVGQTAMGPGGVSATPTDLPPDASPAEVEQWIKTNVSGAAAYLTIPEMRAILFEGAKAYQQGDPWTENEWRYKLENTNWWRTNGERARYLEGLKATDPAEYELEIQREIDRIEPEFAQLGLHVDIRAIAEASLRYGWTQDQLRENFVGHLKYAKTHQGLDEGSTVDLSADALMRMARTEYLVPMARSDVENWAIDIYAGTRTEEQYRAHLETLAKSRFGDAIGQGITPGEYMAPLRAMIADTLELQPADIDFLDPRFGVVMQYDPGTGAPRPMTLSEAERWARSQPEYNYTGGANDQAASFGETLGRMFGRVA